jgi:hypothetical protein
MSTRRDKQKRHGERMKTKEAIKYFGSVKRLADVLGIWPQVIYTWGDEPPMARQYELEVKTKGDLKAEDESVNG